MVSSWVSPDHEADLHAGVTEHWSPLSRKVIFELLPSVSQIMHLGVTYQSKMSQVLQLVP